MPKNRTDITAKKNALKVTVFLSPDLGKRPLGRLSLLTIEQAAALFLLRRGVRSAALSLVFVTGQAVRKINREHLGHNHVTDIVTFDLGKGAEFLEGELVICPAQALRNARAFNEPLEREILRYVAHGILHLRGHDDATERQRAAMRREEDKLLALIWP
jgi:probable rRNA maturation factor